MISLVLPRPVLRESVGVRVFFAPSKKADPHPTLSRSTGRGEEFVETVASKFPSPLRQIRLDKLGPHHRSISKCNPQSIKQTAQFHLSDAFPNPFKKRRLPVGHFLVQRDTESELAKPLFTASLLALAPQKIDQRGAITSRSRQGNAFHDRRIARAPVRLKGQFQPSRAPAPPGQVGQHQVQKSLQNRPDGFERSHRRFEFHSRRDRRLMGQAFQRLGFFARRLVESLQQHRAKPGRQLLARQGQKLSDRPQSHMAQSGSRLCPDSKRPKRERG